MITLEKNYIVFPMGHDKSYRYDMNSNTIYGLQGKPVKAVPKNILHMVNSLAYKNAQTNVLLLLKSNASSKLLRELFASSALLTANKLDNLNITIPDYELTINFLALVEKQFKPFVRYMKENPNARRVDFMGFLQRCDFKTTYNLPWAEDSYPNYERKISFLVELRRRLFKAERQDSFDPHASTALWFLNHGLFEFFDMEETHGFYMAMDTLFNFFSYSQSLGCTPTKTDFFKQMIAVSGNYKVAKCEYDETSIKEHQLTKKTALEFEDENYKVIIPLTQKEFREEAEQQRNCVYRSYFGKVADKTTYIVFVRVKNCPNKSFITCEVNKKGQIAQFLKQYNTRNLTAEERKFKYDYQAWLSENWNNLEGE